jgi:hypothetical protein
MKKIVYLSRKSSVVVKRVFKTEKMEEEEEEEEEKKQIESRSSKNKQSTHKRSYELIRFYMGHEEKYRERESTRT